MSLDSELFTRQIWNGQSRLEVFLRGHLWVEHFLDKMLTLAMKRSGVVDLGRFSWSLKLTLCNGLALVEPWEVAALSEMNRIRNRLAHDLTGEPSDEDIKKLLHLSASHCREAVAGIRKVEEKAGRLPDDARLGDLRFWFLALAIDLDYRSETQEYEKENEEDLWRAMGVHAAMEITGKPITPDEAEKKQGLPPRPQRGDSFRMGQKDSGTSQGN